MSAKKPKTEVVAESGKSDTHGTGVSAEDKQNKEENKTGDSEGKKGGEINKDKGDTTKGDSEVKAGEESAESKSKQSENTRDDIEENLQCIICQEIMHDCIR